VAKELKYVPNQGARSLVSNRSGVVQIVTNMNPQDYYFSQLFTGAADVLSDEGFSIMISRHKVLEFQYDGAIFMGLSGGEDKELKRTMTKPFVIFGKSKLDVDCVDVDNSDGILQVTEFLIKSGHKSIGFIGIDNAEAFSQERYHGYLSAMQKHKLPIDEESVYCMDHSIEAIRLKASVILQKKSVTAFVCASDVLAYGLIEAARDLNISVPEDLSIVGFDGFMFNRMSNPNITTVIQPVYMIGRELAQVLLNRLKDKKTPTKQIILPTYFEEGQSVKVLEEPK
jgi:LacI family transcriptional regulator